MNIKQLQTLIFAFALSISTAVFANPFSISFTDTQANSVGPTFTNGLNMTITIVLDNGSTTAASQTWTAADIVSVTFNMNSGAITTVFEPNTAGTVDFVVGSYTTDAGGILTAVPGTLGDLDPATSTNEPFGAGPYLWQITSLNNVYESNNGATTIGFTTVANNTDFAFWSNPIVVNVGGGGGGGSAAEAAPTLSEWMLMLLALVLGGIGYTAAMKTRKN